MFRAVVIALSLLMVAPAYAGGSMAQPVRKCECSKTIVKHPPNQNSVRKVR